MTLAFRGFNLPVSALGKGVLPVGIYIMCHAESGVAAFPFVLLVFLGVVTVYVLHVIVNNHLVLLPVSFPGAIDYGSGILEHGNQVGDDDALGEEVLGGAVKVRTLEYPFSALYIIILSKCYISNHFLFLIISCMMLS